jgi:hypothetical protein
VITAPNQMQRPNADPILHLRVLFVLGRVSNLPTVWSNCLAAWVLAGGGDWSRFNLVLLGTTFLYLGGMYLNDAFDAHYDFQHRRDRPIPAGLIKASTVWQLGWVWLILGGFTLAWLGRTTGILGGILIVFVLLYNLAHKVFVFSPVLMAACRMLLYLVAASATNFGVNGLSVWSGIALGCYIVGLSYIAHNENGFVQLRFWPVALMAVPTFLAFIVNAEEYLQPALWLMLILSLWVIRCLGHTFQENPPNVKKTVSGLLAGIIWVDLLALAGVSAGFCLLFAALFLLALLMQRFVPAT